MPFEFFQPCSDKFKGNHGSYFIFFSAISLALCITAILSLGSHETVALSFIHIDAYTAADGTAYPDSQVKLGIWGWCTYKYDSNCYVKDRGFGQDFSVFTKNLPVSYGQIGGVLSRVPSGLVGAISVIPVLACICNFLAFVHGGAGAFFFAKKDRMAIMWDIAATCAIAFASIWSLASFAIALAVIRAVNKGIDTMDLAATVHAVPGPVPWLFLGATLSSCFALIVRSWWKMAEMKGIFFYPSFMCRALKSDATSYGRSEEPEQLLGVPRGPSAALSKQEEAWTEIQMNRARHLKHGDGMDEERGIHGTPAPAYGDVVVVGEKGGHTV